MAEVEISPLAKRLAEENNVDWRSLAGSGEDGRIVERDVLDYLARVMAGDEAADPTPEPLPDGMEAWPDGPPAESDGSGWMASASGDTPAAAGDDDLLEVESGDGASGGSDEWSPGEWGGDSWSDGASTGASNDDDDFFAGMGDLQGEGGAAGDEGGFEFGSDEGGSTFDFGETESGAYGQGAHDSGGADFDFDSGGADDRSVFDTSSMEPAIDEGIFVFDDEPATGDRVDQAEEQPGTGIDSWSGGVADEGATELASGDQVETGGDRTFEGGVQGADARPGAASVDPEEPSNDPFTASAEPQDGSPDPRAAAPHEETAAESFDFAPDERSEGGDVEHTPWEGAGATDAQVEAEVSTAGAGVWERDEAASDLPSSDAPWTAVAEEPAARPAAATAKEYDFLDRADESLPDGVRIEEEGHRVVRSGAYGAAAVATAVETQASDPVPEVRGRVGGGIVLRREVDVTAVVEAGRALAQELGGEPSLAAFLLRAAVRAGTPWPLATEGAEVGVARLSDEGVSVSVVAGARAMPFRDLMGASGGGRDDDDGAALAVADVSELGIDEAVLDLGLPVLTIGRVLGAEGGPLHATLTLSGTSAPESGSKFLARVADLLAAPVRLVL